MLTYILFSTLSANITHPLLNKYEVGSGQEPEPIEKDLYLSTEEPTTLPNDDINEIITKKGKKHYTKGKKHHMRGKKYLVKTNELELENTIPASQTTGSIVIASVGGVFFITGLILTVKNYCRRRSGYQMVQTNTGLSYGTIANSYNGE